MTTAARLSVMSSAILAPLVAQVDTLMSYDVRTSALEVVPPSALVELTFDHTDWNRGSVAGFSALPSVSPVDPFPGAGFTDFLPAHRFFPVTDFPIRTAVKLFLFHRDTMRQVCSGIMVAPDLVLTASHCLYGPFDSTLIVDFADSLLVVPAYDNGQGQAVFGSSISSSYYLPKANLSSYLNKDVALIRLRDQLGLSTGWVGIGFSDTLSFYQNRLFHKFSYPGAIDHTDSTRVFNGDTLYYNYGRLDLVENATLGYNIAGVRGQSGSPLFFADDSHFYSVGTLTYSHQSSHTRLTRSLYSSLKSVIVGKLAEIPEVAPLPSRFILAEPYPNPFNPTTTVTLSLPAPARASLVVYDLLGRAVILLYDGWLSPGDHRFVVEASALPSGVYLVRCSSARFVDTKKLLLVR